MATFAGVNRFGSGPTRVRVGARGRSAVSPMTALNATNGTVDLGLRELVVTQTGRLTGSSDSQLWSRVDVIAGLAESGAMGTLVDDGGRSWTGLTLIKMELGDRIDRGRTVSVGYELTYVRVNASS